MYRSALFAPRNFFLDENPIILCQRKKHKIDLIKKACRIPHANESSGRLIVELIPTHQYRQKDNARRSLLLLRDILLLSVILCIYKAVLSVETGRGGICCKGFIVWVLAMILHQTMLRANAGIFLSVFFIFYVTIF